MSFTFVKVFESMLDGSIWSEPHPTRIAWVTMLAMADHRGRVSASVSGLANRARITVDEARAALDRFLAPDPDSRTRDYEGRRIEEVDGGWRLLNYDKYRALRDEEGRREYQRDWDRNRRKRPTQSDKSDSVRQKPTKADVDVDVEKQQQRARKRAVLAQKPDGVQQEVWDDFMANRRSKVTPTALRGIEREARKAGMSVGDALETACTRGWQSFKASWLVESGAGSSRIPAAPVSTLRVGDYT